MSVLTYPPHRWQRVDSEAAAPRSSCSIVSISSHSSFRTGLAPLFTNCRSRPPIRGRTLPARDTLKENLFTPYIVPRALVMSITRLAFPDASSMHERQLVAGKGAGAYRARSHRLRAHQAAPPRAYRQVWPNWRNSERKSGREDPEAAGAPGYPARAATD